MREAAAKEPNAAPPPPPRLVDRIAAQRREALSMAIEHAAIELFAERPMEEVTIEEIAARAGVAVRTLYRYFPSKERIFAALPLRGAARVGDAVRARPASETPFEALRNAMLALSADEDFEEQARWIAAVVRTEAADRIARTALAASTEALVEALAERTGLPPDHLWVEMAGTMAAAAMLVGTKQAAIHGDHVAAQRIAALDVAGQGLATFDPAAGTSSRP